jgi:hypothetical protein
MWSSLQNHLFRKGKTTGLEKVNGFLDPMKEKGAKDEPFDFRADDFVDAMDKLLLGKALKIYFRF